MGVKESIEGRKADFAAYVDPQKKDADVVIEVLPTWEPSDEIGLDNGDKPLRVRLIQKAGNKLFDPAYILDKGSEVAWVPDGGKLKAAPRASSSPPPARSTSTRTSSSWRWSAT